MNSTESTGTIRRAVMDDVIDISLLAQQLGYPNRLQDMEKRLAVILSNSNQAVFVVDIAEQNAAGYIHAIKNTSLEAGTVVEVGGLVIHSLYRRRGLGKLLLSAAETWAREVGSHQIRLRSNIIREEAHQFYKDMGYTINKTQYSFIKTLDL
jgi:GNAT superfamily N-acetyltransferase